MADTGIIYNCRVGRDPDVVARFLTVLTKLHDPAVVLLQEAGGYNRALKSVPGYTVFQFFTAPESGNVAFLVRNDEVSKYARVRVMKQKWWGAKHRLWRAPRSIIILRAVGITWVNIHRVSYQAHAVNREANREIDGFLTRFCHRKVMQRIIIAGDINDVENSPEVTELKNDNNLLVHSMGGIDYALYRGHLDVFGMKKLGTGGGDHNAKKFRFRIWR